MAKIEFRLSSKMQKETGMCEVLIRFFNGRTLNVRAKTGIFVSPEFFEYDIDRKKTRKNGIEVPDSITTATAEKAGKCGYVLHPCGDIVIRQRLDTPQVKLHRETAERLNGLKKAIIDTYERNKHQELTSEWLQMVVDKFNNPKNFIIQKEKKTLYELIEDYIEKRRLALSHARVFMVLAREVARFEGFLRATETEYRDFVFDADTVDRHTIESFLDYLRKEYTLSQKHKRLFKKLLSDYPASVSKGNMRIENRGENTVIKAGERLKALFNWMNKEGITSNRPFDGVEIGHSKVGTPYYITIDERNRIADADLYEAFDNLSDEERDGLSRLYIDEYITQRDIFVFHCFVGCRVGDLIKLRPSNIVNGMLVYTPHKTKDNGEQAVQARVPLHPKAMELIKKYAGIDKSGRLFPFITGQKYNIAIKKIFTLVGITRSVEIRNARTGELEMVPINQVASSHLARRTFIGNAYFKVADPNLIGKMSGHVDGSRAFKRYRNIEDDTLRSVIDLIG